MKDRIAVEDALKHCHECEYQGRPASAASLAGVMGLPLDAAMTLITDLVRQGLAEPGDDGTLRLTHAGRTYARRVIRAHRLYETALARDTGLRDTDWHAHAEEREHHLTDDEVADLASRLGNPRWDPHGDPIPTADGDMPERAGRDLAGCPVDFTGRVLHVEDEPPGIYERLTRRGVVAGVRLRVLESRIDGCRVNVDGRAVVLDAAMSAHIRVAPLDEGESFDDELGRLSDLLPGEEAAVVRLGPACRGSERNRLLDLGIVPGSRISIDLVSPSGNPVAYRIRGASIALRREQADHVYVHRSGRADA